MNRTTIQRHEPPGCGKKICQKGGYMNTQRFRGHFKGIALATVLGLAVAGFGAARLRSDMQTANQPASFKFADPNEGPSRNSFAPIVKKVLPEVVNISSTKVVQSRGSSRQMPQMQMDPFSRQFFGDNFGDQFNIPQMPREGRERGLGSGVIVSPEGYILTNNHVVDGATDIRVTTADQQEYKARVIGTDPRTDIAVLKIDAKGLPYITIGDSSQVQVGDYALAIGDPFGVGETVTMGIVSAMGRTNLGIEDYEDFIQTDAPINPGNSGGALVNDRGELIGINTAILSHGSGGNQGVGFAVPVNLARSVMEQVLKNGKVTRAYLGVSIQNVTPVLAKTFGESESRGALVGDVVPGSPAQKSGLQRGDIILELNGKPVADSNQLRMAISMMAPETMVNLKVWRNGNTHDTAVKLGVLPTEELQAKAGSINPEGVMEGVSVENLTPQSARELGLPATATGVAVTDIKPSSPAADSGLRQGDVIQEVNHQPVKNVQDFERAMSKSGNNALLLVNRQGTTMFLAV
jgi:serine protease Do